MIEKHKVFINRTFNCSVHDLFQWLIEPKLIAMWFGPKNLTVGAVESNPVVSGEYSIELIKPDGSHFFIKGEYIEIDKPSKLAFSFNYIGLKNAAPESVVHMNLEAVTNEKSSLSFVQQFELEPHDMETRTETWNMMFGKLSELAEQNVIKNE